MPEEQRPTAASGRRAVLAIQRPGPRRPPGSNKQTVGATEPPFPFRTKKGNERAAEIYALAIAEGRPIEEVALRIGLSIRVAQRVLRKLSSVRTSV